MCSQDIKHILPTITHIVSGYKNREKSSLFPHQTIFSKHRKTVDNVTTHFKTFLLNVSEIFIKYFDNVYIHNFIPKPWKHPKTLLYLIFFIYYNSIWKPIKTFGNISKTLINISQSRGISQWFNCTIVPPDNISKTCHHFSIRTLRTKTFASGMYKNNAFYIVIVLSILAWGSLMYQWEYYDFIRTKVCKCNIQN